MERNAIASAMDWSIEFEKALRSKNPDRRVEAIKLIEPKLVQWAGEPEATMVVYDMFGLVPGEERLFANTIFLRLAEAFQLGNKQIRVSIVRVFLSLRRHCRGKKNSKWIKGILCKSRVHNHLELLKRVKAVFDIGDPESRALALLLFGCWADFAKDSAQIRYLVLSSLVSSNVLEVKASLFAAGCFSELAHDFASVVLEMLVKIVTYSETESTARLAAVQVFAKMGFSYSIAKRAYKEGLKLVLDTSDENFLVAMLISLSKLAYKSTLLLSEQVDFLLLVLNREKGVRTHATALRCLHLTCKKGMGQSLISSTIIEMLLSIVVQAELPSTMQCEALKFLHMILLGRPPNLSFADMPEFAELLIAVHNASQSPVVSKSVIAIHILVDIVIKFQRRTGSGGGACTLPLPSELVSLIMDRITLLVNPLLDLCQLNSVKVFEQMQSLLNLLLLLVWDNLNLGVLVLDKVHLFIGHLVVSCKKMAGRQTDSANIDLVEFSGDWDNTISSKLACILNRFLWSCLVSLNKGGILNCQVFDKVKLLVQSVHQCSFLDCYTHIIYSLLLNSRALWNDVIDRDAKAGGVDGNSCTSLRSYLYKHELFTLEVLKRMLTQRDRWRAYRVGIYASCQGSWITASFVFGQLIRKVQSDNCSCWLKSLYQLADSERIIQLLLSLKHGSSSMDWLEMKDIPVPSFENNLCEIEQDIDRIINNRALVVAYESLISARRTLESTSLSAHAFCFQRWFLVLRAKVIGAVMEIFRVLSSIPSGQDVGSDTQVGRSKAVDDIKFLQQFTQISFQFSWLSREFDLIASSFIDMDRKSSNIIKANALSCSLLAVCAGFASYIPSIPAYQTLPGDLGSSPKCSQALLIQNLVWRLWTLDRDMTSNLLVLLEGIEWSKSCFHLTSKHQRLDYSCEVKIISDVCNHAISGIICWQKEAKNVKDDRIVPEVIRNGSKLLLNIILKWLCLPFRVPKFFFKVRPCFGSELFISSADTRNFKGTNASHLSLNLCLQLKNLPPDLPVRPTKLYCILRSSQKFIFDGQNKNQMPWSSQPWENNDMVEMNEKLFQYVTERTKRTDHSRRSARNEDDAVTAFAHFEPNERGQGFSNCLLDVSQFPAGSYMIRWHSCCIDSEGSYWSLLPLNAKPVFTV